MAHQIPRVVSVDGRHIRIAHLDPSQPKTYLTTALAAAGVTLAVQDNSGFANSDYLRLGKLGAERSEIARVNAAFVRGTALTTTASVFAHPIGADAEQMLFNQWRVYGNSTDSSSGATLIATIDIQVDAPFTTYVNTGTEYTYYLVVGYNSGTATEFAYSAGCPRAAGYAPNAVGSLIEAALEDAKAKRGAIVTDKWFVRQVNDCLKYMFGKLKRWSFLMSFDYKAGQTSRGTFSITAPSDIEDVNSPKSILSVRVGGNFPMTYADKREFIDAMDEAFYTTVRTQATSGATTLEITNSYDYDDAGTVTVYVSGTKYDITYTGVTRSTTAGVLTGVPASGTGSISVTIAAGLNVWQNQSEGQPDTWSIWDGNIYTWPLPDATYDNLNVYLDYFTSRTLVADAGDVIESPRYDAVKSWLVAKLRAQSNAAGKMGDNDPDWAMFQTVLADMIRKENNGQKFKMSPKINSISY